MWIVPASLYLKVRVIFVFPCSAIYFYKISRFLRIFNNSIIKDYKLLIQLASSDRYGLGNSIQSCLLCLPNTKFQINIDHVITTLWQYALMHCLYLAFILAIYRLYLKISCNLKLDNRFTVLRLAYLFSTTISLLQSLNPEGFSHQCFI